MAAARSRRRYRLLPALGIEPSFSARLGTTLNAAVADAQTRSPRSVAVLDAGCGRTSPLVPLRGSIDRFIGVDIHAPDPPLPWLDAFATVDLCQPCEAFGVEGFDLVLSNFTMEHFTDPAAALSNMHRWLRPGGLVVVTTVNRRHPWVAAYLAMPVAWRQRLQPYVKASAADAHPLVGRCNDVPTIRSALTIAGFEDVQVETVPHLAHAWGRRLPSFALGLTGDLVAQGFPDRRSTIIAVARKPALRGCPDRGSGQVLPV